MRLRRLNEEIALSAFTPECHPEGQRSGITLETHGTTRRY